MRHIRRLRDEGKLKNIGGAMQPIYVPGNGYYVCADAKQKLLEKGREKMKDLTEMLTALAMAGVTKEEITACVEQAFTAAKEQQKGGE